MERDFMGLISKEDAIETVSTNSSTNRWSLSNGFESFNNRHSGRHAPLAPVQLTIFYAGTVNVYNDISPEKAQAIMLLAGNGARAQAQAQAHAHGATPRTGDGVHVNKTLSSSGSVGPSTGAGSSGTMDAPKGMSSLGRMIQSAVPQMRGASLARFLEKRKERVMASSPYGLGKSSLNSNDKSGSSSVPNKDEKK